jgi:CheY-like chemotaxis protein
MTDRQKLILYVEEDLESLRHYFDMLRSEYDLTVGAHWELIEKRRKRPFDLLILDLMIHPRSYDLGGKIVESISFPQVNWRQTGLEFLRRLRKNEYADFGLPAHIPVVVATAVVDYKVREEIISDLRVEPKAYLEKPFTMDALRKAVSTILEGQKNNG